MDSAKIFIDTDNEITFILEKILASKSEKVCLVVPDRAAVFTSISGLKLIKRVVDKSHKLLAVVTLDENGAELAKKAGLSVVSRVGEITEEMWEKIRKSKFEVIKKDKKKVFYVPDEKVKSLETKSDKKDEKISLSEVFKSTFEEGDSNLVVGDVEELPEEEVAEKEVPEVKIKISQDELKKPEPAKKVDTQKSFIEPKKDTLKKEETPEKEASLDQEPPKTNIRQRRASSDTKLSFNEGGEQSQKKNSSLSEKPLALMSAINLESTKAKLSMAKDNVLKFGNQLSKKISKSLKQKNITRPVTPGTTALNSDSGSTKSSRSRVPTRSYTDLNSSAPLRQRIGLNNKAKVSSSGTGFKLPGLSSIKLEGRKKVLFYIGSLILVPLLVIFLGTYLFFNSMALYTVNIRYKFINVTDSKQIIASQDASSSFRSVKLEATESTSTSATSSGQKVVGDRASGFISVFNATAEIKVIKKGTPATCISTNCNGLGYVIDNEVNLGAGSSANDVRIVAADIGENYNLAVNAGRFKIGNFNANTEMIASNIQSISGGTPKVTKKVISAEDVKAIEEKAMNDLKLSIIAKIKNDPNNSDKYIFSESSYAVEKVSAETDKEGTEAETLNTNVTAKGTIDAFDKDQIQPVVDELKNKLAPEGYYLDDKQFNFTTEQLPSEAGKITLKVQVNGVARVSFDIDKIKNDLKGKGITAADEYISKLPNIEGYSSTYSPTSMPGFLRTVPGDPEKIQIKLVAEAPS